MSPALDAATRTAIAEQACAWLGTPYHHSARVHGAGVDCAQLPCAVFESLGLVPHLEPQYPPDWHLHRGEELYIAWLQRVGAQRVDQPRLGDLGLWRYGRAYSHGGIVVGTEPLRIVHAYLGLGVVATRPDEEPLVGRPVQWWSL